MISKECNLCGQKKATFISIKKELGNLLKQHKFPYPLRRFETLNYKAYACSECGCSDRDRLYKQYFEKYLQDKKIVLLDFAPSKMLREYLKKNKKISYRSADLFMDDVDDKVDIQDMKAYESDTFDFVICSHVLEHVKSDKKALSEIYRVLKPGGKAILMTPIISRGGVFDEDPTEKNIEERWRRFAQDDHVRLYTKSVFKKRVRDQGFTLKEYTAKELGLLTFLKYAISPKSVLYVVSKKRS